MAAPSEAARAIADSAIVIDASRLAGNGTFASAIRTVLSMGDEEGISGSCPCPVRDRGRARRAVDPKRSRCRAAGGSRLRERRLRIEAGADREERVAGSLEARLHAPGRW